MECNTSVVRFEQAIIGRIYTSKIDVKNTSQQPMFIFIQPEKPYTSCLSSEQDEFTMTEPGQTKTLTLEFLPQLDENIMTTVKVQGVKKNKQKISKPLKVQCFMQQVCFRCDTSQINFGKVILGQTNDKQVELTTQGIGPVSIQFLSSRNIPVSRKNQWPKQQLEMLQQLNIPQKVQINNDKLIIKFEYSPTICGNFRLQLSLRVLNNLRVKPIKLLLLGQAIGVPIVSLQDSYDFKICLAGHTYKQWLEFRNYSQVAAKVQVTQPYETRKYFQFDPSLTYISKQSTLKICVTFRAEKEIWSQLTKFGIALNPSGRKHQRFQIPMELNVSVQQTPVKFNLCFTLTYDKLVITPQVIDFGKVYAGTASKCQIQLKNESLLLQQLILISDSKSLIVDMDQPIKILPSQTVNCRLLYRSECDMTKSQNRRRKSQSRSEQCELLCMAITGNVSVQDIRLLCVCNVISPELQLSCNKINLPVVQIEETYDTSFKLTNKSQNNIVFQVFLPHFELCGLKITPMVKNLQSGESTELSVEYASFFKKKINPNMFSNLEQNAVKHSSFDEIIRRVRSSSSVSQLSLESLNKISKEPPLGQLNMMAQLAKLGGKYVQIQNGQCFEWLVPIYFKQKDFPDASAETVYIEISTISVPKTLLISQNVVNFGEVSVGSYEIRQLEITNLDVDSEVQKSQLHPFCGFQVINSLKTIKKGETCKLIVRFKPLEQTYFQEKLVIKTNHSIVNVILKGSGIRPEIDIYPCDGRLDLGHVMLNMKIVKTLRISNLTIFPVKFSLKRKQQASRNKNGMSAFTYIPNQGYIEGDSFVDIGVQFQPDKPSDCYFEKISIEVKEQKTQQDLFIFGSCYDFPVYVYEQQPLQIMSKQHVFDHFQPYKQIRLQNRTNFLNIGCCSEATTPYNFSIETEDSSIRCQPNEGKLHPGSQVSLKTEIIPNDDQKWPNMSVLSDITWKKQLKFFIHISQGSTRIKSFEAIIEYLENDT